MLENEDSVVTSLNELRKLKHERITRQTQARPVVGGGRAAALAVDPASDQMTPPPVSPAQSQPVPFPTLSSQPASAPFGGFAAPASGYAAPPVIQTRTSYKAAVFVAIVLVGAAGAGYVKLENDTQARLAAKESALRDAEQARMQSAELVAKAEVQARNNLRQCEDKLKAAAVVPAAAAAPSLAAPAAPAAVDKKPAVVEKKPEKPAPAPKVAAHAPSHKAAARPSRKTAQAEPAASKPAGAKKDDVPTIAKKKKLDNDPLAGLGKL